MEISKLIKLKDEFLSAKLTIFNAASILRACLEQDAKTLDREAINRLYNILEHEINANYYADWLRYNQVKKSIDNLNNSLANDLRKNINLN